MHAIPSEHTGLSVTRRKFLRSGARTAAIVPGVVCMGTAGRSRYTDRVLVRS